MGDLRTSGVIILWQPINWLRMGQLELLVNTQILRWLFYLFCVFCACVHVHVQVCLCVCVCTYGRVGCACMWVCRPEDNPSCQPSQIRYVYFSFFETESLIGLEFNEKARVTGQQAQESTHSRLSTSGMTSMHYIWHFSQDLGVILSSSC